MIYRCDLLMKHADSHDNRTVTDEPVKGAAAKQRERVQAPARGTHTGQSIWIIGALSNFISVLTQAQDELRENKQQVVLLGQQLEQEQAEKTDLVRVWKY